MSLLSNENSVYIQFKCEIEHLRPQWPGTQAQLHDSAIHYILVYIDYPMYWIMNLSKSLC